MRILGEVSDDIQKRAIGEKLLKSSVINSNASSTTNLKSEDDGGACQIF